MILGQQKVIVTAGASGIGRAVAQAFLETGARVYVMDVDENAVAAMPTDNQDLACTVGDVTNEDDVKKMFAGALEHLGGLSSLINCAGIAGPTELIEDISLADWKKCVSVTLDGSFLCSKYAIPIMKAGKDGSIINLSSTAGLSGFPFRSPYSSTKWAIIGFTKTLAMELGPYGIRSNVICPGSVDGPRMDKVIAAESITKKIDEDTIRERWESTTSLKTFVSAEDIANMIVFLCSEGATRVSGQVITVDGHTENFSTLG